VPADVSGSGATRKRPFGVTLLSLLMGWLTVSAVLNAAVFPAQIEGWPVAMTVLTLAYAVTAGAVTLGLWRMRPWALTAFRAWGVVLLLTMVAFLYFFGAMMGYEQNPLESGILFVATTGTMALIYWLLHRYIRKRVVGAQ
jgi:glucan phosphoethanolaminetransferase (alkaline phosphatase superfamily)